MLGTCQKEVNYHWFSCDSWCPKLGAFGKMYGLLLGLIAGVSFACLTPVPLCSFVFPVSFLSRKFLETPATQASTNWLASRNFIWDHFSTELSFPLQNVDLDKHISPRRGRAVRIEPAAISQVSTVTFMYGYKARSKSGTKKNFCETH